MSKQINWIEVARRGRNHANLIISFVAEAFDEKVVAKKMGWRANFHAYRQLDGARWLDRKDVELINSEIQRLDRKNPEYLLTKGQEYMRVIMQIRGWVDKNKKVDFSSLTNRQLEKKFERYLHLYKQTIGYVYNYIFINEYLVTEVSAQLMKHQKDTALQSRDLFTLITPIKLTEAYLEKRDLAKLAGKVLSGRLPKGSVKRNRAIEELKRKYGHLGLYIYYGNVYTNQEIEKRVGELLNKDRLTKTKQELSNRATEKQVHQVLNRYPFRSNTKKRIKAARTWSYVPNYWDDTFVYAVRWLMPMFKEMAKRMGVTYSEMVEMIHSEISQLLGNDKKATLKFRKELKARYQDSATIYDGKTIKAISGLALKKYYQTEIKVDKKDYKKIINAKGQVACSGRAVGRVCVIKSITELKRVKKGDVIIAHATTPMHVPAMEKAAAIIVETGGLLSHAAIVSRELNKPCLVGVQNATSIFKDGERVEVDNTLGIAKKI
ncbi:MAG: PEP-utilizing enzyme [bacterium]